MLVGLTLSSKRVIFLVWPAELLLDSVVWIPNVSIRRIHERILSLPLEKLDSHWKGISSTSCLSPFSFKPLCRSQEGIENHKFINSSESVFCSLTLKNYCTPSSLLFKCSLKPNTWNNNFILLYMDFFARNIKFRMWTSLYLGTPIRKGVFCTLLTCCVKTDD